MRAIIVDDEKASRDTLQRYIEKYCADVVVLELCENIQEGLKAIKTHQPDLVFLDVEMPYGNAFDLLEQVDQINFETIFVTAFSHYAMKALNFSASYYLLKPIDIDELVQAVGKVKVQLDQQNASLHTKVLVENMRTVNQQHKKIVLPVLDGFELVQVKDIVRLQANDNFTDFHLLDGTRKVICRTLKFYEEVLAEYDFLRIHKSHIINLNFVQAYKKGKGGQVTLTNGSVLDVSATRKASLLERF